MLFSVDRTSYVFYLNQYQNSVEYDFQVTHTDEECMVLWYSTTNVRLKSSVTCNIL